MVKLYFIKIYHFIYRLILITFYSLPFGKIKSKYLEKILIDQIFNKLNNTKFSKKAFTISSEKFLNEFNKLNKKYYSLNLLQALQFVYLFRGDYGNWKYWMKYAVRFQENLSRNYNIKNNLNIRTIEHGYFLKTIGSNYEIDALIKAMKLNLIPKHKIICKIKKNWKLANPAIISYWSKYINFNENISNKFVESLRYPHHIYIPIDDHNTFHTHSSCFLINQIWDKKTRSLIKKKIS